MLTVTTGPVPRVGTERRGAEWAPAASHDLTFGDLLDIINPLQHIPVVGTLYRALSGDEISGFARVAGDFLFGGPLGLMAGMASASIEETTGSDLGEHALALLEGDETPAAPVVAAIESAQPSENEAALAALAADLAAGATVEPSMHLVATAAATRVEPARAAADAALEYQRILRTMQSALDRYDALKSAPSAAMPASY